MPQYTVTDFLDGTSLNVKISIKDGSTFDVMGLVSIAYGSSLDSVKVKGTGGKYRGRTPGIENADDSSLEIFVKDLENWIDLAGGEDDFLRKEFDVTISHRSAPGRETLTKKLKDCRMISVTRSHDFNSAENLTATCNFSVLSVE